MVILLFLISSSLFALNGVITVLEAPMFSSPNREAKVLQWKRKGDEVFVHDIHDQNSFNKTNFVETTNIYNTDELVELDQFLSEQEKQSAFFKTLDRNGRSVFMLKEHIKIIYNDDRELINPIASFKPDTTDYRIQEPLPESYPLIKTEGYRGLFQLGFGLPTNQTYKFSDSPTGDSSAPSAALSIYALRKVNAFGNNRFYVGGIFQTNYSYSSNKFENGSEAKQSFYQVGFGPALNYQVFVGEESSFALTGAISINILDNIVIELEEDKRSFRAISFTPLFSAQYIMRDVVGDLDFALGPQVKFNLAQSISAQTDGEVTSSLWGDTESITRDFSTEISFLFGLQQTF